jgi:hypothetical protein
MPLLKEKKKKGRKKKKREKKEECGAKANFFFKIEKNVDRQFRFA